MKAFKESQWINKADLDYQVLQKCMEPLDSITSIIEQNLSLSKCIPNRFL